MNDIKDGGPAFPVVNYKEPIGGGAHMMTITGGMTLRDYFAAKAMPIAWDAYDKGYWKCATEDVYRTVVAGAYQFADAMLAERERSK